MSNSFAMLAHHYAPGNSSAPVGWMVSRKLNGWGAVWDGGISRGVNCKFISWYVPKKMDIKRQSFPTSTGLWSIGRNGEPSVINAPDWWLDTLPVGIPTQGELWKDDDLAYIKSVCGQGNIGKHDHRWKYITYYVYNIKPYCVWGVLPESELTLGLKQEVVMNTPWLCRMRPLWEVATNTGYWRCLEQEQVESMEHFDAKVYEARLAGWEGLMLTNPRAWYEKKRSKQLLKVKDFYDYEATIVGCTDGTIGSANEGKLGSLAVCCTWGDSIITVPGGTREMVGKTVHFNIGGGFSAEEREWDWSKYIGRKINFRFLGVSNDGIPPSASFNSIIN